MDTSRNNDDPIAIAKQFLAGIKSRDKASMRTVTHSGATACLIRDGRPVYMLVNDILDRIPDDGEVEMDEVSRNEVCHRDGDFATVWTPYKFFEDGKVGCRSIADLWYQTKPRCCSFTTPARTIFVSGSRQTEAGSLRLCRISRGQQRVSLI